MAAVATKPDIGYSPNLGKYLARTKRRVETEQVHLNKLLPPGFPRQLVSQLVWEGDKVGSKYQWLFELDDDQVTEIEGALHHFKCMHHAEYHLAFPTIAKTALVSPEQILGLCQSRDFPSTHIAPPHAECIPRVALGSWLQGHSRLAG